MTTEQQVNSFFLPGGILDDDDDDEVDRDISNINNINNNNTKRMMELSSKGRRSIRPPPGFMTATGSGISSTGTTSSSSTIKTSRIGIEPCSSTTTKFYDMRTNNNSNSNNSKAATAALPLAPIGAGRSTTLHPHYHPLFATTYHPNHTTTTTTTTTTNGSSTHIPVDADNSGRANPCDPLGYVNF